jgi:hypothetical protein
MQRVFHHGLLGVPQWLAHAIEWLSRSRATRPRDVKGPRMNSHS